MRKQSQKLLDSLEIWHKCLLCEISRIAFGVQCPKWRMCRDIQKYLNILYPIEGNSLKSILTLLLCIKFEIYIRYSGAQWNCLFRKWVDDSSTARVQGHTKEY